MGDGEPDVQCAGEHADEWDGDVPAGGDGAGVGGAVRVSVGEGRDGDHAECDADGEAVDAEGGAECGNWDRAADSVVKQLLWRAQSRVARGGDTCGELVWGFVTGDRE